jgi:hypothetical protein
LQTVFFPKLCQFAQGNYVLDAAASNINVYFGEVHGFLQVSGIGFFGKNRSYLNLETYRLR